MSDVSRAMQAEVVLRARNRCEYCRLSQLGQEAAFHLDHILPRAAGGPTVVENLALACVSCSLRKWAKQTSPDPDSGQEAPLFNPRPGRRSPTRDGCDRLIWRMSGVSLRNGFPLPLLRGRKPATDEKKRQRQHGGG